jgi:uncharacterized protein YfcZ (UPF0381/DUF406 family)
MRRFGILSNASWDDFKLEACNLLGVDQCRARLGYYMMGQDFYSGLSRLRDSQDWETAMAVFCDKARAQDNSDELEFEILDVNKAVRFDIIFFCVDWAYRLPQP